MAIELTDIELRGILFLRSYVYLYFDTVHGRTSLALPNTVDVGEELDKFAASNGLTCTVRDDSSVLWEVPGYTAT